MYIPEAILCLRIDAFERGSIRDGKTDCVRITPGQCVRREQHVILEVHEEPVPDSKVPNYREEILREHDLDKAASRRAESERSR